MTTKKKTTHKTHKTHKAKAHEKKSQHVSDKISTTSLTENIAVLAVAFLVIGLIVGFSRLRKEDDDEETYY